MQFDVHLNTDSASAQRFPFLLDVQSDILSALPTRLVVPITKRERLPQSLPERLCPEVAIQGVAHHLMSFEAAAIQAKRLGPVVCSLKENSFEIINSIDAVLSGV
jgi:toxin CcdB